uniref:CUB domain-containing protein n=1 Tax=Macrostomum lignano TaxID=282301 RepID=A0A1I8FSS4_9PLAT
MPRIEGAGRPQLFSASVDPGRSRNALGGSADWITMPLAAAANALALPLTALLLRLAVLLNLLLWAAATGDLLPQQPEACANFTGGAGFQSGFFTFTTPNYPARYPARSDCIKLIRGGEAGLPATSSSSKTTASAPRTTWRFGTGHTATHRRFPASCAVEFAAGGRRGDPPLVSTGRYLCGFASGRDDSIEHAGMKAVYSFEQANNVRQECRLELRLPVDRQEVLTTKQLKDKIPAGNATTKPVDCSIDATSPEDTKPFTEDNLRMLIPLSGGPAWPGLAREIQGCMRKKEGRATFADNCPAELLQADGLAACPPLATGDCCCT